MTGPISGDTNMAATILGALFSTSPRAARELRGELVLGEADKRSGIVFILCGDD